MNEITKTALLQFRSSSALYKIGGSEMSDENMRLENSQSATQNLLHQK